jgi:hypothetical protein
MSNFLTKDQIVEWVLSNWSRYGDDDYLEFTTEEEFYDTVNLEDVYSVLFEFLDPTVTDYDVFVEVKKQLLGE